MLEDHWSSFLQRPKNAIPKSSKQDEAERAKVKNTPFFRDHIYVDAVCFRVGTNSNDAGTNHQCNEHRNAPEFCICIYF